MLTFGKTNISNLAFIVTCFDKGAKFFSLMEVEVSTNLDASLKFLKSQTEFLLLVVE